MNDQSVPPHIVFNLLAFIFLYLFIFILGSVLMAAIGLDFETAISSVATSIGNVGPGIGTVGPSSNFFHIPAFGKWVLALLMLVGRLEIFTVLIIFSPYFWRRN